MEVVRYVSCDATKNLIMKTLATLMTAAAIILATASCAGSKAQVSDKATAETVQTPAATSTESNNIRQPQAVLYKMSDGCANLVPVTLSDDGTRVIRYPATSDIRPDSKPVHVGDGWYLDRIGVTDNTVFTTYTLDQYSSLPATPTADELMRAIKAGSKVTAIKRLNMTPQQALDHYNVK